MKVGELTELRGRILEVWSGDSTEWISERFVGLNLRWRGVVGEWQLRMGLLELCVAGYLEFRLRDERYRIEYRPTPRVDELKELGLLGM